MISVKLSACFFAFLAGVISLTNTASAAEPYRILSPSAKAPHPAVLLVSGCSGFTPFNGLNLYDEDAAELQAAGYLVVYVDYLGRRNLKNCRGGGITPDEVGKDVLEAATWTKAQAGVAPDKIFAIGWSYGGGGVIMALAAMPPGTPLLAKAVMYYPACRNTSPWSSTNVSVLMLMGELDEVAPPAVCDAVVKGVPASTLRTIMYPNARHAFDVR